MTEEKKTKQKKCKNCKGSGYVPMYDVFGNLCRGIKECPICKGTGRIENEKEN